MGFFYVKNDLKGRGFRIYRHQAGSVSTGDTLIYEETDPNY